MTGSAGEVVDLLRQAIQRLDRAALTAAGAQTEANESRARFTEASRGSGHAKIRRAVDESQIAGDKAGKIARLLAQASGHLANYCNIIAPDSVSIRSAIPEATPSGGQLVTQAVDRGPLSSKLMGRTAAVPNPDDGLQYAKKITNNLRDAASPGGATKEAPHTPVDDTPRAHAGDALLAALTVAIVGIKTVELAARLRQPRPDSREDDTKKGGQDGR